MSQAVLRKELRQRIREKCEKFSTRVIEWNDSLRSKNLVDLDFQSLGIKIHWNDYIPSRPSLKQLAVLALDDYKEVLFGGAAGGGKSELLLMSALQYVDISGYSAIIFRRTLTAAARSGGIMDRAHSWLAGTDAVWDNRTNAYLFPSGATLAFGYVDSYDDFQNYQGPEYQFIGWDELTQFPSGWGEESYRYMFSRMRRLHGVDIPLRVRAACNPGGWGHTWVKQRFDIKKDLNPESPTYGNFKGNDPERPFVPSYAWDNPYLDVESYMDNLLELDPVTREQLLNGDWSITQEGRFKPAWFRRYSVNGPYVVLAPDGKGKANLIHSCRFFITVDPATTDVPTGESLFKNREPSWSVISTWCVVNERYLLLWHVERFQQEIPEVCKRIRDRYRFWTKGGYQDSNGNNIYIRPEFIGIENNGTNIGVFQICSGMNLPIKPLSPSGSSKLVRSTDAACRAEAGSIYLPATNCHNAENWLGPFEDEIFRWVGHEHQTADQVDTLSYAAIIMSTEISATSPHDPENVEPTQGVVMEASGFLNPAARILGPSGRDTHGSLGPTNY